MSVLLKWIGAAAIVFGLGFLAGADWSNDRYQRELAAAKAHFEQLVSDANKAYADQKVIDDAALLRLQTLVTDTPPNPAIALKKDAAGRVGAIK